MKIKEIEIKNFGKFSNQRFVFRDGIQVFLSLIHIYMSDRIVAFSSGYTTGELSRNEFSQERIMTMATER